ncbi:MAG: metallophosphoesterase family protein [Sporolactobacillus sp.]
MLKIAVLSDIHGNAVALQAVVHDMLEEGVRSSIFLGDLIAKGPQPLEVLELLSAVRPLGWILGNTDLWLKANDAASRERKQMITRSRLYMEQWLSAGDIHRLLHHPERLSLPIGQISACCLHGSPRDMAEAIMPDRSARLLDMMLSGVREPVVLCGHSHLAFNIQTPQHIIFNPGSVGCPYDGDPNASYGIITYDSSDCTGSSLHCDIKRVSYCREQVLKIARQRKYPFYSTYANMLRSAQKIE